MSADDGSLFTPRPTDGDGPPGDPAAGAGGRGWRWVLPGTDNPTGWRLATVWALGSLVVAVAGLLVAALLGGAPSGVADRFERIVVFPVGSGRQPADPLPPAAPVPGESTPAAPRETARTGADVPRSDSYPTSPAYPGYPAVPGVPLPPAADPTGSTAPDRLTPPAGTPLPAPAEPTTPAQQTATADPTGEPADPTQPPPAEETTTAQPTQPAETTTEPPAEPTPEGELSDTPDEAATP